MKQILTAHTFGIGMKVPHRRAEMHMPHLLLDCQKPRAAVHEVRGEAVTDQVRVDTLFDPGTYQCVVNNAN